MHPDFVYAINWSSGHFAYRNADKNCRELPARYSMSHTSHWKTSILCFTLQKNIQIVLSSSKRQQRLPKLVKERTTKTETTRKKGVSRREQKSSWPTVTILAPAGSLARPALCRTPLCAPGHPRGCPQEGPELGRAGWQQVQLVLPQRCTRRGRWAGNWELLSLPVTPSQPCPASCWPACSLWLCPGLWRSLHAHKLLLAPCWWITGPAVALLWLTGWPDDCTSPNNTADRAPGPYLSQQHYLEMTCLTLKLSAQGLTTSRNSPWWGCPVSPDITCGKKPRGWGRGAAARGRRQAQPLGPSTLLVRTLALTLQPWCMSCCNCLQTALEKTQLAAWGIDPVIFPVLLILSYLQASLKTEY